MRYLICSRGKPENVSIIPELVNHGIGVELQSYGLEGIVSQEEWNRRLHFHTHFRQLFDGYLAVHGPFIGVCFCHPDHLLKAAVQQRMDMTFEMAVQLRTNMLILHSGMSNDVVKFGITADWIKKTVEYWRLEINRYADAGITVALENIVDETPEFLKIVHDEVNHPNLKICLDTGHVNVWSSVDLDTWLHDLGDRIVHVHLHSNDGRTDQHAALDMGNPAILNQLNWIDANLPDVNVSLEMLLPAEQLVENVKQIQKHLENQCKA